jgi:hypothetical protein
MCSRRAWAISFNVQVFLAPIQKFKFRNKLRRASKWVFLESGGLYDSENVIFNSPESFKFLWRQFKNSKFQIGFLEQRVGRFHSNLVSLKEMCCRYAQTISFFVQVFMAPIQNFEFSNKLHRASKLGIFRIEST